jgi:DnaJ family protein C protein 3
MSDINQAHEILGNEESRARYDQGEDPNDPMQQQQRGGSPFGGGFQFQGGFPFQGQGGHGHGFPFHF